MTRLGWTKPLPYRDRRLWVSGRKQYPPSLSTMLKPAGFPVFPCYFNNMDPVDPRAREIAIAIDAWIREVDEADLEPDAILASFEDICQEFDIPEDIAKNAVSRALDLD